MFGASTERALAEFQEGRGLHVHGRCDEPTWTALVEASYQLGDRLLVLSAPNMRGDDVADLQSVLARLGFDCGRVDGILGPTTASALEDFQRNCGLTPDGVCGAETVRALDVLGRQSGTGPGVAALREFEALSGSCRRLGDLRVVIGQFGGMSSLTRQVTHALRQRGATVTATDEPDAPAQAATANRFAATVYVGFEARAETVADRLLLRGAARSSRPAGARWPHDSYIRSRSGSRAFPSRRRACACRSCARPGCRPCSARSAPCRTFRPSPRRRRRRRRSPRELGRRAVLIGAATLTWRDEAPPAPPPEPGFTV